MTRRKNGDDDCQQVESSEHGADAETMRRGILSKLCRLCRMSGLPARGAVECAATFAPLAPAAV
jgi:hypothetical protein